MLRLNLSSLPNGAAGSFVCWDHRNSTPHTSHSHTFCELFWVESGEGYHWINGEQRLMTPGYLALIRPEKDAHAFSVKEEGGHICFHNLAFHRPLWERIRRRHFQKGTLFFSEPDHRQCEWLLDTTLLERVRILAKTLLTEYPDALSLEAFLLALLTLLRNQSVRLEESQTIPEWLLNARERVQAYPAFQGGASAFVRYAGRCPEHVARECRRHFKMTPREMINEARLNYAASQLCISSRPILDIVLETGIENVGHFYRLFQKKFQRTPRNYRLDHSTKVTLGNR